MDRRLSAIMSADMEGYASRMAADEEGTIRRHKSHRAEIIDPEVAKFGGRIVKTTGDGFLAEFGSAVHAVQCAVEMQASIADTEQKQSPQNPIKYRIGINIGDVVTDGNDIFGEGVNIAARLEQLADAGGICLSEVVHHSVKSKLALAYECLGLKELKNIPDPIEVYRVRMAKREAVTLTPISAIERPNLPGKPSIAVLPFVNMSSVPEYGYFADGMTEDIITALSRVRELFVIARNSTFAYKGRPVRIEDVARDLGVAFVLEGSVRAAANRVRVTAQLIDGITGAHVWAENYDGSLDDIFAVQDEITRNIALAMQVNLTYGDFARVWEGQTSNLRAWEKMAHGRAHFLRFNAIDNQEARRIFQEALALDPKYTGAIVQLGLTYWWDARFNTAADKQHCLKLAEEQIDRALHIDPEMGSAWMLRGGVAWLRDQHDEAVILCEKAVDLAPSDSWATAFLGLVCNYVGHHEKARAALSTAIRLSPYCPAWYLFHLALANLWLGEFAAAQEAADKDRQREGEGQGPHSYVLQATIYGFQGRHEDATKTISELKRRFHAFGIADVILAERYKDKARLERVLEVCRTAGLAG